MSIAKGYFRDQPNVEWLLKNEPDKYKNYSVDCVPVC